MGQNVAGKKIHQIAGRPLIRERSVRGAPLAFAPLPLSPHAGWSRELSGITQFDVYRLPDVSGTVVLESNLISDLAGQMALGSRAFHGC